jgi:hypothetical protein
VFRAIDQWQKISAERLTDRSVARIVKSRVKALVKQRGRSEAEAKELVELISGEGATDQKAQLDHGSSLVS